MKVPSCAWWKLCHKSLCGECISFLSRNERKQKEITGGYSSKQGVGSLGVVDFSIAQASIPCIWKGRISQFNLVVALFGAFFQFHFSKNACACVPVPIGTPKNPTVNFSIIQYMWIQSFATL